MKRVSNECLHRPAYQYYQRRKYWLDIEDNCRDRVDRKILERSMGYASTRLVSRSLRPFHPGRFGPPIHDSIYHHLGVLVHAAKSQYIALKVVFDHSTERT